VKAKGNVNTSMAQLVEVGLEEEIAIRLRDFERTFQRKGSLDTRELEMCRGDRMTLERSE